MRAGDLAVVRFFCEKPPVPLQKQKFDPLCGDDKYFRKQWPVDAEGPGLMNTVARAAICGHVHVVRYLCELPPERGVQPAHDGNLALKGAASRGHVAVVRYLWELSQSQPWRGIGSFDKALNFAAHLGHLDVVRYLCKVPGSLDLSACGNECVRNAAWEGHLATVEYLLTLPCVDPAVVLALRNAGEPLKDAARKALARRERWCAWVGAVALAAAAVGTTKL